MIPAAVSLDAAVISWWRRRREPEPRAGPGAEPAPVAVAAAVDGEAEGHPASPAEDPAGGSTGPGAPAAGDTLAEVPGGLGSSSGRFAGFDGLRAVAALGARHPRRPARGVRGPRPRGHYLSRLDVGVAVFFVLSGFLLYRPFVARRMDGRPASGTRPYLRNRFLRIFPAYWLALTVLAVVLDVRDRNDFQSLGDFVTYYGLLQSYSADTALGGLQQAWTLTNEVAFYLLPPLWAAGGAWLGAGWRAGGPWPSWGSSGWRPPGRLRVRYWLHSFAGDDVTLGTFDPGSTGCRPTSTCSCRAWPWRWRWSGPAAASAAAPPRVAPPPSAAVLARRGRRVLWAVSTQLDLGFEVGPPSRCRAW